MDPIVIIHLSTKMVLIVLTHRLHFHMMVSNDF
jgi:hypothetical protein